MENPFLIYTIDAAAKLLNKKVGTLRQIIKRLKTRDEELVVGNFRFILVSKNCYIGVEKDSPFEVVSLD